MIQYTVIPKEIIKYKSNAKLSDIYIFSCIKITMNFNNAISKINQETISKKFNIPERTLRDAIKRLERKKLIAIEQKIYENENANIKSKTIRKNYYKFELNPENYFFVTKNFFKLDAPKEVKGFLLILKAICLNDTNVYISSKNGSINISELSKRINMDTKTLNKYLNKAKELELIKIRDNVIIIKTDFFPLRVKEVGVPFAYRNTEIINTIQEICNELNAIMPRIKKNELDKIHMYYYLEEREIEAVNIPYFTHAYSLKYILKNRIKSLPKQPNIGYFFKVLNIPKPYKKEKIKYEFILD